MCGTSDRRSRRRAGSSLALTVGAFFALTAAALADEIRVSPAPPRAGEPITVTFHGIDVGCLAEGRLDFVGTSVDNLLLEVEPPGCPFAPVGFAPYSATTTLPALPAGEYLLAVFEEVDGERVFKETTPLRVVAGPSCDADATSLCLLGRFSVVAEFATPSGSEGVARAVPDDEHGLGSYGVLWFFAPDNPELLVKVLDGCAVNGRYWVFVSPGSNLELSVTIRDAVTGRSRTFANPQGRRPRLFADTSTFSCS